MSVRRARRHICGSTLCSRARRARASMTGSWGPLPALARLVTQRVLGPRPKNIERRNEGCALRAVTRWERCWPHDPVVLARSLLSFES